MLTEVSVAVSFVASFLYGKLPRRRVHMLGEELDKAIRAKFQGHWYPEQPLKGTAYRCLKLSGDHPDLLVFEAARNIGLEAAEIFHHLPENLTLWIDPGEVSYRIGEKGIVSVLYSDKCLDESPSEFNPEAQDFVPASEQLLVTHNFAQLGLYQQPSPPPQPLQQDLCNYNHYMLQKSSSAPNFFTAAAFAQTKFGSTKLRQQTRRTGGGRQNSNGSSGFNDGSGRRGANNGRAGGGGLGSFGFNAAQQTSQSSSRHSALAAAAFNRSFSLSPGVDFSGVDWSTGDSTGHMLSVHISAGAGGHLSSNGSSRQASPGAAVAAGAAAVAANGTSSRPTEQLLLAK